MAALLVTLGVMAILLTVALPSWRQMAQREREAELIWRGEQYARAVGLFQRKFANAFPPSIDVLVNQRFLRKAYKDPMVSDGQFQVLYQTTAATQPGQTLAPGSRPGVGASGTTLPGQNPAEQIGEREEPESPFPTAGPGTPTGTVGPRGGIIGVVSKSTKEGLRLYRGRSRYNEWQFVYTEVSTAAGQPGGVGGAGQPGVVPGGGSQSRPGLPGGGPGGPGGFGRPGELQPQPRPPGGMPGAPRGPITPR